MRNRRQTETKFYNCAQKPLFPAKIAKMPERGSPKTASSTIQSFSFRTYRRISRNPRVCARFAIMHGPGERPRQPESVESSKTYPGAIWLGPWIIAVNSPAHGTRRTGLMKVVVSVELPGIARGSCLRRDTGVIAMFSTQAAPL
jgi:hypothetical protein